MAGGGGGGGGVSRAQQPGSGERRGHRQKAAWLPLDVVADIAARSDPATLVRCAATCRDARRRIAQDSSLLVRLRLRYTDRFVLPLLRGHLTGIKDYTCRARENTDVYMMDTTGAADATRLVKATFAGADKTQKNLVVPVDSRGGLVLVHAKTTAQDNMQQWQLLVCNPATRRRLVLPPEPAFPGPVFYEGDVLVLLVGDRDDKGGDSSAAVGRPFQVLKARLELSQYRNHRRLLVHTFSSEHGTWSPLTEIPTPDLHGKCDKPLSRQLVVGDDVHWLCMTDSGNYMLILHVGAARVNVTSLPASFPRDGKNHPYNERRRYLLATASAGGNPVVLVADTDNISSWEQSKHTRMWKPRPQVVIENEAILGFNDDRLAELVERHRRLGNRKHVPSLLWFGERSGVVLLQIDSSCLLWLDLHSKKIVRCFLNHRVSYAQVYCPYEVDLSSWVPTFDSAVAL